MMVANKYVDSSFQKAFSPTVPGCTKHPLMSSILAEAHSNHKSVAICWLDLANAYGSVHHSLIDFSLRYYYAPPQFLATVKDLYTSLSAKVTTADWETPVIPLHKGVYQGDPLAVVIFNTVMNILLDTISLRLDLGYQFSNSSHRINILQYADDTCLVADSPASCQHLLDTTAAWLQWSGMEAKIPKCQCLSMKGSSGKLADPHVTLSGVPIPFSTHPVGFLGFDVQVPKNHSVARESILATDDPGAPCYLDGAEGRPPGHRVLEDMVWAWEVSKHSFPAPPSISGWLESTFFVHPPQRLQVSRQCQLLTSQDSCVRFLVDCGLKCELRVKCQKFRPAEVAREALQEARNLL